MTATRPEITARGRYSPEEDAFILEHVEKMTQLEIAKHLGRGESSVNLRYRKLIGSFSRGNKPPNPKLGERGLVKPDVSLGDVVDVDRRYMARERYYEPQERGEVIYIHDKYVLVQFDKYREAFDYGQIKVVE